MSQCFVGFPGGILLLAGSAHAIGQGFVSGRL